MRAPDGARQALDWNRVAINAAARAKAPRSEQHEFHAFSTAEARRLLDAVKGDRLEALYSVALALGMRRGEILGLTWSDIDLDARTLRVERAIQRISTRLAAEFDGAGGLIAAEPKTRRARRTMAIPDSVVKALRLHRARQAQQRLLAGSEWQSGTDLVFTDVTGGALDPRTLHDHFKAALAKAGLPDVRFHDLRHSAASLLLAQGVPMRAIMELLGHSQITLTVDTYSHIAPDMLRETADKMEAILG